MYLLRYSYCLILLLPILYGCNSSQDFSHRTSLFLVCMNQFWDYERECVCEIYPKGYKKEDYCDTWASLRIQGYQVALDVPR